MILIFDIFTVLFATVLLSHNIKKVIYNNFEVMDLVAVIYYFMQVFPLLIQYFKNFTIYDCNRNIVLYNAMTDETVALCYDLFCIITVMTFYFFSQKDETDFYRLFNGQTFYSDNVKIVVRLLIYLPLFLGFLFAPVKGVYLTFSYFYNTTVTSSSIEYIYHHEVISTVVLISSFFVLLNYYISNNVSYRSTFSTWIGLILCTWFDGKRTLLVVILLGIVAIDYIKGNFEGFSFFKRCSFFLLVILIYFAVYSLFTNKGHDDDWFTNYFFYFNRLNVEKLAIYDKLYTNKMLDYNGQTILFNLFFFVPRLVWADKPAMYCKYFTGYAYHGDGSYWVSGNYQVNVWGEFVSNFGLLGHFLALAFLIILSRFIIRAKTPLCYSAGLLFILLYQMFGFESVTLYVYISWIISLILKK